ncbi:hypothetical protein F5883DRAFT_200567 [Diaporthe sp. PMI_573]|nr:hypothetical protein F5883DRAFT_200567 [Diaporthaceae sp. PMI_573]
MQLVSGCRHFQFSAVVLSLLGAGASLTPDARILAPGSISCGVMETIFVALLCSQMTQPVEASWQCEEPDQAVQCCASLTSRHALGPKTMDILKTCEHCHMCNFLEHVPQRRKPTLTMG